MDFEKYEELRKREHKIAQERLNLDKEFSKWLGEQKNWKIFILNHLKNYIISKKYTFEYLSPSVNDVRVFMNSISFKIKVYGETISHNHWLDVCCKTSELLNIPEDITFDNRIVKELIRDREEEIEDLKSESDSNLERIKNLKQEIEKLEEWLEE